MSPVREAVTLPLVFLTVVLLGGVRVADGVQVVPPALFSLVLAAILCAALLQSGTVDPARLMHPRRPRLANANGFALLVCLFLATAQAFSLMTPDSGLPAIVFNLFFLVMLVQVIAASLDRRRLLRVLAVTVGAAFTLKFVVLAALSSPAQGRVARALQLLFDGVTMGAIVQGEPSRAGGYLAFATLALYVIGVMLMPAAGWISVRSLAPVDGPGDRLAVEDRREPTLLD